VTQIGAEDGVVGLVAQGTERFEVESWLPDEPYPRAEVRVLPELEWDDSLEPLRGETEQLVRRAVVHFFRGATERVEQAVARAAGAAQRVGDYLGAVATELAPASARFFDDVAAFPPAAEVYQRNTEAAAHRVRELVDEGVAAGAFRDVPAAFVAEVVSGVMVRIQQRQLAAALGLSDADAYANLAELLLHGLAVPEAVHPGAGWQRYQRQTCR